MSEAYTKANDEAAFDPLTELEPCADLEDILRPKYTASDLRDGVRGKYLDEYQSRVKQLQQKNEKYEISTRTTNKEQVVVSGEVR